jgi:hypothetical protein
MDIFVKFYSYEETGRSNRADLITSSSRKLNCLRKEQESYVLYCITCWQLYFIEVLFSSMGLSNNESYRIVPNFTKKIIYRPSYCTYLYTYRMSHKLQHAGHPVI